MKDHYILNERGDPVVCEDLEQWVRWWNDADRTVWVTMVGDVKVSTVFLGSDHNWGGGEPLIYETMVFGNHPMDGDCTRYATVDDALLGHIAMIKLVEEAEADE